MNKSKKLNDDQFYALAHYLKKKYGLNIPFSKKMMIESRLQKRLHLLGQPSFASYLKFIFEQSSKIEYNNFIDLVTTHKTYFFREDYQFEFLKNSLPLYFQQSGNKKRLNVWSSGCSTGEEVYSIGMIMNEFREKNYHADFHIIGTDVSVPSLQKAAKAVFQVKELEYLPEHLKDKYLDPILEGGEQQLKFNNREVSSRIKLGALNLNNSNYNLPVNFDFIFCRNVIIYFDMPTQHAVLKKLVDKLKPGGFLFLGHSESAIGTNLPIKSIRPTIYQKI
ncbi:CheR family methyltransferase [Flexithrix dorotheae]|uniref:CheR family methyltransferase n=1 Tax=Flexithrix dorotheae TaxID=70993 RepID=UPI000475DFD5|nr:CheR family methyltransferase [Flexithrix dorotheae]